MPNQPDNAIDKVLAGLRDAAPPEGLESRVAARIAERLDQSAQHAQTKAASRWGGLLTGQSLTAAWFRGAATGAAFALLAVAAMLALRHTPTPKPQQASATPTRAPAITPAGASKRDVATYPCTHPAGFRVANAVEPHLAESSWTEDIAENTAPSRPAPVLPLTAQERQLARLVRTSNLNELAAISHESQAKQPAEDARFFAPPSPPPTSNVPAEINIELGRASS